jgi:outer membrane autotransporter protein
MSSIRSTGRLSLLAGSSLAAASLFATVLGVGVLVPVAAQAANECAPAGVDPSANGAAPDTFTCSGTRSTITYTANGPLTLSVPGTLRLGTGGATLNSSAGSPVTFSIGEAGSLSVKQQTENVEAIVMQFGAGEDAFANAGVILLGPRSVSNPSRPSDSPRDLNPAELRLLNLETFENSGLILLGGFVNQVLDQGTDVWADDILSMNGADFIGSDDSHIIMDVDLNGGFQTACNAGLRDDDGDLAADCVSIVGGSTAGSTLLTLNDVFVGARGAYNPEGIVLIDVAGGTSAAEHFTLDPNSSSYSPAFGGSIDKGMFVYPFVYDEATQQHKLVTLAAAPAYEQPMMAQAANSLWRLGAGGFFERQADLRDTVGDATGGSVWLRGAAGSVEREVSHSVSAAGHDFDFDIDAKQNSFAVTGGMDLISTDDGSSSFVLGLTGGYASSEVEFSGSGDTAQFDGLLGGVYASVVMGDVFADLIVSGAKMDMKNDIPALSLFPSGTILRTDLRSVGARLETGYRFGAGDGLMIEPLAGLSYVTTSFDDVDVPAGDPTSVGNIVAFDDLESLRASLGLRASLDSHLDPMRVRYSLTGRVIQEFQGEASTAILNPGEDAVVGDDLSGTFGEVAGSVGLFSTDGAVSGFVNGAAEFGDGYTGMSLSAGVRYRF